MQILTKMPLKYKIMMGVASGFAAFYLTISGIGLPLARHMEERYYSTGIAGERVNVYSKPSVNSDVIGTLEPLTSVDVIARKEGKNRDADHVINWYKIELNEKGGWIADKVNDYLHPDFATDTDLEEYLQMLARNGKGTETLPSGVIRISK